MATRDSGERPPELPRLDLRERRRLQTRREVVEAAMELFVTEGFEATTIERIAERAGISAPTFYRYFPAKEDVVFFDAEERSENLRTALRNRREGESVLSAVREFCVGEVRKRERGPDKELLKKRFVTLQSHPALRGRFLGQEFILHEIISEAVASDLRLDDRRDTLPCYVAGTILGAICSVGWSWYMSGDIVSRFTTTFDLLDDTLSPLLEGSARSGKSRVRRKARAR